MKTVILNTLALFLFLQGFSQTTSDILNSKTHKVAVDSIAEALATLALDNPQIRLAAINTRSAEIDRSITKMSWLNSFYATSNVNEFTLKGQNTDLGNRFYPKYNLGVRITIGELVSLPKTIKASSLRVQASMESEKIARQSLRTEVIVAYQDYALTQQLIAFQQDILQDVLIAYNKAEEKFKKEELSFERYTEISHTYNGELVKMATLNKDLKVKQATLETLIGMPLDDAFNHLKAIQQSR